MEPIRLAERAIEASQVRVFRVIAAMENADGVEHLLRRRGSVHGGYELALSRGCLAEAMRERTRNDFAE
jgi:hypothetical protein